MSEFKGYLYTLKQTQEHLQTQVKVLPKLSLPLLKKFKICLIPTHSIFNRQNFICIPFLPQVLWCFTKQTANFSNLFQCRNDPFVICAKLFYKTIYPLDLLCISILKEQAFIIKIKNTAETIIIPLLYLFPR